MTDIELFEVLWNVQNMENRGIFIKDIDPMDVKDVYEFNQIVDNYEIMSKLENENN